MDVVVISANTSWYLFNFRKNTIITLLEQGFEVYAIAPKDDYSQKLEQIGAKYVEINIDRAGKNPIKDLFTIIKYFLLYFRIKPQVVFNFTPKTNIYSTVAAKLVGASSVNNIAGLGLMFVGQSLSTKLVKFLYRVTQWMSAHIYFQNQDDMKLFIENKLVPSQHSISRLPGSGVDLKRFSLQELPETDAANFILVARLLVEKGVELYAEAARQLKAEYPDANFYLLGFFDEENPSGVSRGQVANWEKQGIIEYLGVTDNIEQTLKVATCVVLPSYYREGVPKTLLEAAALGKPIVTTNSVGCRETILDKETGFLCEPKDIDSLVSSLRSILEMSRPQLTEMGKKGRDYIAANFNEEIVLSEYANKAHQLVR